ncbi:hypothetical protein Tco_0811745 [Tanacetum coccineum]
MKEKLNEVPQSYQTDSYKEQVFINLVGLDRYGSDKTFGGGVSTRDVFGAHSSLRNTPSLDAIERMIEAKVAAHVSNYEKAQMESFKKLELLLGRELSPPSGHQDESNKKFQPFKPISNKAEIIKMILILFDPASVYDKDVIR